MKKIPNILLVDDDKEDQLFFLESLEDMDTMPLCSIANNGIEALNMLSGNVLPDLIFMDINMPRMNGLECLAILKKNDFTKHIPIIMYSTSFTQAREALTMGAYAIMQKADTLAKTWEQVVNFIHQLMQANYSYDYNTKTL